MDQAIRILDRKVLSHSYTLLEDITIERRRFDGQLQTITREVYNRGDAAAVLLYDASRSTVVLIRQFRPGAFVNGREDYVIEACAGKLEGEDPAIRIVKEAREETGYAIKAPQKVFEAYMSPACLAEKIFCFVAPYSAADKVAKGGGLAEEGEDIEVLEPTLADALRMIARGEIVDAKTIMLLQYAELSGLMKRDIAG